MLFRDVTDLLFLKVEVDDDGFRHLTETGRNTVFANKKSVRSSEFYLAAQTGYSVDVMFDVRTYDYQGQNHLEFESTIYEVFRVYNKGEFTELICRVYKDSP